MELLPVVASTGWAWGLNAYLVLFGLGLMGRLTGADAVPDILTRTDVLVVSGVLLAVEIVVDKVAYVDTAWDGLQTLVRPLVGGGLAILMHEQPRETELLLATVGAAAALASHAVKAGIRVLVNSSPGPAGTWTLSSAEDLLVVVVVLLGASYPWWALGVSMTFFGLGVTVLVIALVHAVRRGRTSRVD